MINKGIKEGVHDTSSKTTRPSLFLSHYWEIYSVKNSPFVILLDQNLSGLGLG